MQHWTCGLARHGGLWVCAFEARETARVFLVSKVCIRSLPWRPLSTQHALVLARYANPPPKLHYLFTNLFPGPISSHPFALHHHLIYTSYIVRLGKIHGQNVCFKLSSLSTRTVYFIFYFCFARFSSISYFTSRSLGIVQFPGIDEFSNPFPSGR